VAVEASRRFATAEKSPRASNVYRDSAESMTLA